MIHPENHNDPAEPEAFDALEHIPGFDDDAWDNFQPFPYVSLTNRVRDRIEAPSAEGYIRATHAHMRKPDHQSSYHHTQVTTGALPTPGWTKSGLLRLVIDSRSYINRPSAARRRQHQAEKERLQDVGFFNRRAARLLHEDNSPSRAARYEEMCRDGGLRILQRIVVLATPAISQRQFIGLPLSIAGMDKGELQHGGEERTLRPETMLFVPNMEVNVPYLEAGKRYSERRRIVSAIHTECMFPVDQ